MIYTSPCIVIFVASVSLAANVLPNNSVPTLVSGVATVIRALIADKISQPAFYRGKRKYIRGYSYLRVVRGEIKGSAAIVMFPIACYSV